MSVHVYVRVNIVHIIIYYHYLLYYTTAYTARIVRVFFFRMYILDIENLAEKTFCHENCAPAGDHRCCCLLI